MSQHEVHDEAAVRKALVYKLAWEVIKECEQPTNMREIDALLQKTEEKMTLIGYEAEFEKVVQDVYGVIALKVFNQVAEGMSDAQRETFKTLTGDISFDGDDGKLASQLIAIRDANFEAIHA